MGRVFWGLSGALSADMPYGEHPESWAAAWLRVDVDRFAIMSVERYSHLHKNLQSKKISDMFVVAKYCLIW